MRYNIYCNLKTISDNHKKAIAEFEKRLSIYCDTNLYCMTTLSLSKEVVKDNHFVIYLLDGPSTYTSEGFAQYLQHLQLTGISTIHILIGFDEKAIYEAFSGFENNSIPNFMSLSRSRLSTETKTLLFYEQLYRGYTIIQGKTYHK